MFLYSTFLTDQCHKIPEETIKTYFQNSSHSTTQILLALYVLTFNDYIIAFQTEPKFINQSNVKEQTEYSTDLLDHIPIRSILNHVEAFQGGQAYKSIYSDLLALSANLFPELFDIQAFLIKEGKESNNLWNVGHMSNDWQHEKWTITELESRLNQWETNPAVVIEALSRLESIASTETENYAACMISTLIPPCLDRKLDKRIAEAFVSTWEAFNIIIPHSLWLTTINFLIPEKYTLTNLIQNPNIIFKCDKRIFRSHELLPIWLHVLNCLRTTSKHRIWKRYHTVHSRPDRHQFNSRNVLALTNAQDTMMLQLLLELCLERPQENKDTLYKVRKLICDFIHSIFIDGDRDMLLAKILHFQTYSTDLIPMVVDYIPSIYIVLSFIPELTRQPQIEKQVFGILMACHLCEKYPLENYLLMAEKHVLPRLLRIAFPVTREGQPSTTCVPSEYLIKAIPGFVHLARAFPHFGPQILNAFDDIAKGLPEPRQFIGQEGNNKIILVLQLHKVLKSSRDLVQTEVDKMDKVNKVTI
ncbi:integrator complex subunit 2 [Cokeromyces recurvatus]|uniref:integrator complex subunit 2 n=1 Tax=Cokeromyces recurvatus TaxID=90255 RepID=UPI00221EDC37|nr:integrator complex subunit 2 [Cokeromyces recurvatus]KAI7898222.1 integrator complex subunit 2 [Cokeromyces recurvatus]